MRGLGLFLLAFLLLLIRLPAQPFDWDSASYRAVALHLLHGEGAVSGALWNLLVVPDRLPMPSDLYWMPLPSRILLPALALGERGDQILNALLGAGLAPLAWALAKLRAPDRPNLAVAAGLVAATGGAYARFLGSADSVAIFGVLGGLGFLSVGKGWWKLASFCAVLAALTRNDGFLLGIAFGVGLWAEKRDWRALGPLVAGIGAWLAWQLRNGGLVEGWWATRASLSGVLSLEQLIRGEIHPLTIEERIHFAMRSLPATAAMVGLIVLPFPAIFCMRGSGWFRAVQWYTFTTPLIGYLLAPAIFAEGSFFRSSIALYPIACVLAVEAWSKVQVARYHPAFLASLIGMTVVAAQALIGAGNHPLPFTPADCQPLQSLPADATVFSNHPPFVELFCGHPAVILPAKLSAEKVEDLVRRYQIQAALLSAQPGAGGIPDPSAQLKGWAERDGLYWPPTNPPPPASH